MGDAAAAAAATVAGPDAIPVRDRRSSVRTHGFWDPRDGGLGTSRRWVRLHSVPCRPRGPNVVRAPCLIKDPVLGSELFEYGTAWSRYVTFCGANFR